MRFYHFAQHGVAVLDWHIEEEGSKGGGQFPISWKMYLFFMECPQGKNVVSVEGYFMGTLDCEWLQSWHGNIS